MRGRVARLAVVAAAVAAQALLPGRPAMGQPEPAATIALTVGVTCSPALTAFQVEVRGDGFNPFTAVLVTFDAAQGGRPESADATTDGFGRFDVVLHPRLRPAGSYLVRADDFREGEATATAAIDCPPPVTPTPTSIPIPTPEVFHPALQFHPGVTRRGFVVALRGTGFPRNATVHLDWGDLRGRTVQRTVTTDGNGVLSVPRFLVFEETPFGTDRVLATADHPGDFDQVTARLLVVPGTAQPPSFKVRS
jgi:hypothetical protein